MKMPRISKTLVRALKIKRVKVKNKSVSTKIVLTMMKIRSIIRTTMVLNRKRTTGDIIIELVTISINRIMTMETIMIITMTMMTMMAKSGKSIMELVLRLRVMEE